jgi:hypothetical protein
MASPPNSDEPLKELKHDAVPGYLKAFVIAFAVMGLYLVAVLISSPGPAKGHHGEVHSNEGHDEETEKTEGKH